VTWIWPSPENGAIQLHQTEPRAGNPNGVGSPSSRRLFPLSRPLTNPDGPINLVALTKKSLVTTWALRDWAGPKSVARPHRERKIRRIYQTHSFLSAEMRPRKVVKIKKQSIARFLSREGKQSVISTIEKNSAPPRHCIQFDLEYNPNNAKFAKKLLPRAG